MSKIKNFFDYEIRRFFGGGNFRIFIFVTHEEKMVRNFKLSAQATLTIQYIDPTAANLKAILLTRFDVNLIKECFDKHAF